MTNDQGNSGSGVSDNAAQRPRDLVEELVDAQQATQSTANLPLASNGKKRAVEHVTRYVEELLKKAHDAAKSQDPEAEAISATFVNKAAKILAGTAGSKWARRLGGEGGALLLGAGFSWLTGLGVAHIQGGTIGGEWFAGAGAVIFVGLILWVWGLVKG